ncbi:MAG TPA: LecA/PA-IL family lectin [Pyrinomonadaceae bacterium]|nr:LecA/PA-IL family lectin [Pyrinomonadaceae bacterium]
MKNSFRLLLAIVVLGSLTIPTLADTIRLKDGSVIRGQVIGFKDQQFVILIGSGAKGRRGQTTVFVEDVESIEFDSNPGASQVSDLSTASNQPPTASNQPPAMSQPSRPANQSDNTIPINRPADPQPTNSSAAPTFFTIKVSVRADNANNGWTNSGLVVRKGQRLRITASGRVSLGRGRFATPGGVTSIPDNDKLMRNEATGALIAVIGDDNDDFLLIGPRREFVAQRDGVLFLGVNEGDLSDNTGSYDIVIEAEANRP